MPEQADAVVVGSGPNGLAAAAVMERAGWHVVVHEAEEHIGGGVRSETLTLPGFVHDVCSSVHPLAVSTPFFASAPLAAYGLEWVHPPAPVAHPFDDEPAAILERSVGLTAASLGADGPAWRSLFGPLAEHWAQLQDDILGPPRVPRHPLRTALFGSHALLSVDALVRRRFRTTRARGLFGGVAAHSMLAFDFPASSALGLVLAIAAHAVGWPFPRGGSQRLADALANYIRSLGGEVRPCSPVHTAPDARAVLWDTAPRQLLRIYGARLPESYRRRVERYRYGPGVFKMDWALNAPVPWKQPECARAATVHLGGSYEEIAVSERAVWNGAVSDTPFVLLTQPSLFDSTRAPVGMHTLWAYCHVPHGAAIDMTARIENQIERFAPGFRDCIVARHTMTPADLERHDANCIGGDINGGAATLRQMAFRPTGSTYSTPVPGVYLCSASTPPGGGVHGMCGYHAAKRALRDLG